MMLSNFSSANAPLLPGSRPRQLAWLLLPILLFTQALAQDAKHAARNNAEQAAKVVESPIKIADVLYKSGNRRDPFLNPLAFKKNAKVEDEEITRGLPPPGIAGTYIAQASFQGTSIRNDHRLAIVRGVDARAYFLKEGDRLFDGYLKDIQLDSITLVRETKMKSGKTLTQDVTKRLRIP